MAPFETNYRSMIILDGSFCLDSTSETLLLDYVKNTYNKLYHL